ALPHKTTRYSLFAIRYSPFATRCCFNIRQSLFAAVSRLADLPISRFADKIRLGRNFALPLSALQKSHPPVANCQLPFAFTIRHSLPFRLRVVKAVCHSPLTIRHSLLATRPSKNFRLQAKARIM
ncbi:MAG: hypothetical protein RRA51_04145, partial [Armatimonadota bacterium]|nr:hypothetical protein [Armatimonadota bacterium]